MQPLNFQNYFKIKKHHSPLLFNAGLWCLIFATLLVVFTKGNLPIKVDFAYTAAFLLFLSLPVSLTFYLLIPKFLKQERYILFTLLFTINWLFFAFLLDKTLLPLLDLLFPDLFFISYPTGYNFYLISGVVLLASTLLKLAEDWFYFNANQNRLLQLKNQQVESQLSTLKAQINPHFLFNSLNVIYALALEKSNNITEGIVQLSDILRYVLYDTNVERVPLKKELTLLENYIAFQELRQRDKGQVELYKHLEDEDFQIYPMLLLPLVENAFKYSANETASEGSNIRIKIVQKDQMFCFQISNAILERSTNQLLESSDIGLKNIRNNLQLVYPDSHQFIVQKTAEVFSVELTITLKK